MLHPLGAGEMLNNHLYGVYSVEPFEFQLFEGPLSVVFLEICFVIIMPLRFRLH